MLSKPASDYAAVVKAASQGSPLVLEAVGRLYGLGQNERAALIGNGVPGWAWLVVGLAAGFFAGVRVQKGWPNYVPRFVQGE